MDLPGQATTKPTSGSPSSCARRRAPTPYPKKRIQNFFSADELDISEPNVFFNSCSVTNATAIILCIILCSLAVLDIITGQIVTSIEFETSFALVLLSLFVSVFAAFLALYKKKGLFLIPLLGYGVVLVPLQVIVASHAVLTEILIGIPDLVLTCRLLNVVLGISSFILMQIYALIVINKCRKHFDAIQDNFHKRASDISRITLDNTIMLADELDDVVVFDSSPARNTETKSVNFSV